MKKTMFKEKLKKLAENPNFIPGIYNYCDRWCEKCSFNRRCMNFALENEHFSTKESKDINNEIYWEKLTEIFQDTIEMLKEISTQEGIDLTVSKSFEKEKPAKIGILEKECLNSAKKYGTMVNVWFKKSNNLLINKEEEINLKYSLNLPNINPEEEASRLNDTIEIIRWYQHFIYVKLNRAIDAKTFEEDLDEVSGDSDGSAKITLISIDRSIAAWGILLKYFPDSEDDILNILIHLNRLRSNIEQLFPSARKFIRPGFEDER
jgi:hypothetical protein